MLLLLLLSLSTAPQAPASAASPARGTAVIRGQVTDRETGQPIARASVTLHMNAAGLMRENVADADGRFEFLSLPEGAFSLSATAGESRATHVRGFQEIAGGGRIAPLKAGEERQNVNITLVRSLAISGRVVNDAGEPLARVDVLLGHADTGDAVYGGRPPSTDDRGAFRLFGVERGRYIVCAESAWGGTGARPIAGASTERYVKTCHPSESEAAAVPVAVTDADVEGVEIRMRRTPTYTVSGIVLDSSGQPLESGAVSLDEYTPNGSRGTGSVVGPGGRFAFHRVAPGQYSVSVQIGGPDQPQQASEAERGAVPVDVVASDIENLVVKARKAAKITGRLVFDGAASPAPDAFGGAPMMIGGTYSPALRRGGGHLQRPAMVRDDLTFELLDVFGPVMLNVSNPPRGWLMTSVLYRGKDIIDTPTDFPAGTHELEVVLTDRGAIVTGSVTDDRGQPVSSARIIVFPADALRRRAGSSYDATARTSKAGAFRFGPIRPGDYMIVALPPTGEPLGDYTLGIYERLAHVAERITLLESDRRTMNLRIATLPQIP